MASQGIPSKITSTPAVQPMTSYAQVTTNVLLPSELAKTNKVNVNQIQVTPIIGSIVALATDPCVTSVNPLMKMLNPVTQNALVAYDLDRNRKFLSGDLLMVAEAFRRDGDVSVSAGVNQVHAMTGTCAPIIPGYASGPKGIVNAKSADARAATVKKIVKKELGGASTTTTTVSSQGLPTAIQPQLPGVHKATNIEANLPAKQGKSMMTVAEVPRAKTVRNLASFPYGQQMLFSNGMKQSIVVNSPVVIPTQSIVVNSPIPTQVDHRVTDSVGLVVDLSNGVKTGEVPRRPTEAPSGQGKRQCVPQTQQEPTFATLAAQSRTPLQCLQQMVENTGNVPIVIFFKYQKHTLTDFPAMSGPTLLCRDAFGLGVISYE